ncbi:MAG: FAD-binding oxidoreductase [Candidatus Baldrarchaeia archaeon]
MNEDRILRLLEDVVGSEYVSCEEHVLYAYSKSNDPALPERMPDYVVRPGSTEEVAQILKIANRYRIPVIPRSGGCCLTGGSRPIEPGGIVLDLTRMNRVLDIDEDTMTVTVECGITWAQLNAILGERGYYTGCLGPGSGLCACVGGGLSHHSVGGGGGAKYGPCTANCTGLEVVLPTGVVIKVGAWASNFIDKSFTLYAGGPMLAGLFFGDNGLLGVKTKAVLRIYPVPEYHACKTFALPTKDADERATRILYEWRLKADHGVLYDAFYFPPVSAIAYAGALFGQPLIKGWLTEKGMPRDMAVVFYVIEAHTEETLHANEKLLDKIAMEHGAEPLGEEIHEGNIAKWFYEKQGHWQIYHPLWCGTGPRIIAMTTEHIAPIKRIPMIQKKLDEWQRKHSAELAKVKGIAGVGQFLMVEGFNVEVTSGIIAEYRPENMELCRKLWIDQAKFLTRLGAYYYMLGEVLSMAVIDAGAFSGPYYEFLRQIKYTLDPNRILSPGKFYL